jgi:hypothetical protein
VRRSDSFSEREIVTDRQHHVYILGGADTGRFREDSFFFWPSIRDAAAYRNPRHHTNHTYLFLFYLSTQLATYLTTGTTYLPTYLLFRAARRLSVSVRSLLVTIMTFSIFIDEKRQQRPRPPRGGEMEGAETAPRDPLPANRHLSCLCEQRLCVYHPTAPRRAIHLFDERCRPFSRPSVCLPGRADSMQNIHCIHTVIRACITRLPPPPSERASKRGRGASGIGQFFPCAGVL